MAADDTTPSTGSSPLTITATGNLIWLDDPAGSQAWVVHRLGVNAIDKNDQDAPLLDAQGQVQVAGNTNVASTDNVGNGSGQDDSNTDHPDPHPGIEDPPVAVADSVTARAGATITIPVTGNDYDPDGDPIAVLSVGDGTTSRRATVPPTC
jgi:hypothetical protein